MAAKQAVQVGTNLVSLALAKSVALGASGLEEVGALLCVTYEKHCQMIFSRVCRKDERYGQAHLSGIAEDRRDSVISSTWGSRHYLLPL